METYVAISLFVCLSEVIVNFFSIFCNLVFCSFSGAVNMVKFDYPYLTFLKAVIKYLSELKYNFWVQTLTLTNKYGNWHFSVDLFLE